MTTSRASPSTRLATKAAIKMAVAVTMVLVRLVNGRFHQTRSDDRQRIARPDRIVAAGRFDDKRCPIDRSFFSAQARTAGAQIELPGGRCYNLPSRIGGPKRCK